jgi:hypothetical protein
MIIDTYKEILFDGLKLVNPSIENTSTLDLPLEKKAIVEVKFYSETYSHVRQIGSFTYETTWSDDDVQKYINDWVIKHEYTE